MRSPGGCKALSRAVAESVSISAALLPAKRLHARPSRRLRRSIPRVVTYCVVTVIWAVWLRPPIAALTVTAPEATGAVEGT